MSWKTIQLVIKGEYKSRFIQDLNSVVAYNIQYGLHIVAVVGCFIAGIMLARFDIVGMTVTLGALFLLLRFDVLLKEKVLSSLEKSSIADTGK